MDLSALADSVLAEMKRGSEPAEPTRTKVSAPQAEALRKVAALVRTAHDSPLTYDDLNAFRRTHGV